MKRIIVQRTRSHCNCGECRVPYMENYGSFSAKVQEFATVEEAQAKVDEMVTKEYRGRTWEVLVVNTETPYSKRGEKNEARIASWGAGANGEGDGWSPDTEESDDEESDDEESETGA